MTSLSRPGRSSSRDVPSSMDGISGRSANISRRSPTGESSGCSSTCPRVAARACSSASSGRVGSGARRTVRRLAGSSPLTGRNFPRETASSVGRFSKVTGIKSTGATVCSCSPTRIRRPSFKTRREAGDWQPPPADAEPASTPTSSSGTTRITSTTSKARSSANAFQPGGRPPSRCAAWHATFAKSASCNGCIATISLGGCSIPTKRAWIISVSPCASRPLL
jgi:hypothetical protein